MIEGDERLDAVGQQFVDQPVVEIEAFRVRRTRPIGKYPRPCNRKPVGLDAQFLDQADVVLVPVIVIVGTVGIAAVRDLAGSVGERIPDRAAPAVFVDGAFDLIGGGSRAPDKTARETGGGVPVARWLGLFVFR